MTNKSTKKALALSIISLVVCVSMLVGTTFAWFTDSVTSANNIIKSGNLDVTLEWMDGKLAPADADDAAWLDASQTAIFSYELWEPGFTQVRHIKIGNEGSLALKYKVVIDPEDENADLAKVIDVYYLDPAQKIADRTDLAGVTPLGTLDKVLGNMSTSAQGELAAGHDDVITIALKMQETAGNEYMNKSVGGKFSVKLVATQLAAEEDSFGKDYDDPATYPAVDTVTVPEDNTEDVVLSTDTFDVTVPADAATEGDVYKVEVSNENTVTDSATGETTVGFDLTLYKNDTKVSGSDTIYKVDMTVGENLLISEVAHNGTALTKANTGADQTWSYDSASGVLTIYTKSFSPFEVVYNKLAEAFADNSWENIIKACKENSVPATWNVGDKKAMTIGGNEYDIAIIGKNHDAYSDGSGKAPLTFQVADIYGTAAMNATQTNATGWSGSKMRTGTMVEAFSAMPLEVQNAIKAVDKETLKGDGSGLETTSDKLFLMSLFEVYGSTFYSNGYEEGSRYAYYTSINDRIMSSSWWLRGPGINNGKNNGIGFTQINMSGYMANGSAEYASGVIFGFCF